MENENNVYLLGTGGIKKMYKCDSCGSKSESSTMTDSNQWICDECVWEYGTW